jgi:Fic family protein
MYVLQEAVLSSQIEGTQSSLEQILRYDASRDSAPMSQVADLEETTNYVKAMNLGLEKLARYERLDLAFIRDVHRVLMTGVRGGDKTPCEFRIEQNWVGPKNASIEKAIYIPPTPADMAIALQDFERYLPDRRIPVLLVAGMAHAQFETIHPFRDGNGRIGRLLIPLLLCQREVLRKPLLYVSLYLKARREEYYAALQGIREHGDWEAWLEFFLRGVAEVAEDATRLAREIATLREAHRKAANWKHGYALIDAIYRKPVFTVRMIETVSGLDFSVVNSGVKRLVELGFVEESTGHQRNRLFILSPYLSLFRA